MEFTAHVKGVKADVAKKEITISFVMDMSDANMEEAQELATYTEKDAGAVVIKVLPYQLKLQLEK